MGCLKLEILEKYDNLKITFRAKNSVFLGDLDYYPFGMQMPGRSFNSSSYRFGYNAGSEKDDEITGVTGSHFTTFFREFDTRIGRPWTPDPVFQPWQSPYSSMDNNPIWFNDPLGDLIDDYKLRKSGKLELIKQTKDNFHQIFNEKNEIIYTVNIKIDDVREVDLLDFRSLYGIKNKDIPVALANDRNKDVYNQMFEKAKTFTPNLKIRCNSCEGGFSLENPSESLAATKRDGERILNEEILQIFTPKSNFVNYLKIPNFYEGITGGRNLFQDLKKLVKTLDEGGSADGVP